MRGQRDRGRCRFRRKKEERKKGNGKKGIGERTKGRNEAVSYDHAHVPRVKSLPHGNFDLDSVRSGTPHA